MGYNSLSGCLISAVMKTPENPASLSTSLPAGLFALLADADAGIRRLEPENPYRLYEFLHAVVRRFAPVDAFYVCLYSEPDQALYFPYNAEGDIYDVPVTLPLGSGPTSQAILGRRAIVWNTEAEARSCGGVMFGQMDRFTHSAMHVPIVGQGPDAPILGVISAQSYRGGAYPAAAVQALQWLADRAGLALARERDDAAWRYRLKAADARAVDRQRPLLAMAEDVAQLLQELSRQAEDARRLLPADTAVPALAEALARLCESCCAAQTNASLLPLRHGPAPVPMSALDTLTPGERTVLEHLAAGSSNKAVARALGVTENTIKSHCKSIFSKLGVSSRTTAARLWLAVHPS